jgi:glycosyltransferase involved in cell wall biosynthesis
MPLISIIIPTFNGYATLPKSLDSILSQTFSDYEVWVIDGMSTDNTVHLIKEYRSKGLPINFISEPDKGVYDAMNKGIALAKGKWIYFLGNDDSLFNNNILEDVSIDLRRYRNKHMCYGNVVWGNTNELYYGMFNYEKLLVHNICHQAMFTRRDILIKHGMFNLSYPALADWDMNFKLFQKPSKQKYINKTIAFFTIGGISSHSSKDPFRELLAEKKREYYKRYSTRARILVNRVLVKAYSLTKKAFT